LASSAEKMATKATILRTSAIPQPKWSWNTAIIAFPVPLAVCAIEPGIAIAKIA
jgi:hypothetical protein